MSTKRLSTLSLCLLLASIPIAAQQPKPPAQKPTAGTPPPPTASAAQAAPGPMTNADVIKLAKAGLGESVILIAIREAKETAFDTSSDGLVKLKVAGVSDAVLAAIMSPRGAAPQSAPPPAPAVEVSAFTAESASGAINGEPVVALTALDPGIYLDTGKGVPAMIPLEPASFSQGKSGGVFTSALTYGLKKAKWKAVVRSPRANVRTALDRPTFYFRFEQRSSGPGGVSGWLGGATSPNEFVLAQMTERKDSRELIVGEFGALGASTGTRSEDTVPMKVERLAAGLYKVTPSEDLGPGEFCLFYSAAAAAGAGPSGKLFDFGVEEHAKVR
jgi:hypothetical protein